MAIKSAGKAKNSGRWVTALRNGPLSNEDSKRLEQAIDTFLRRTFGTKKNLQAYLRHASDNDVSGGE